MFKHPYYNQNPNLSLKKVETVHGNIEYHVHCKKYDDGYYVKGQDLVYDDASEEWVKPNGKKVMDHEVGREVSVTSKLTHGVVSTKDGKEVMGYYSPNRFRNGLLHVRTGVLPCMDVTNLDPKYYVERLCEGIYYRLDTVSSPASLSRKSLTINNSHNVYNVEDNKSQFKEAIATFEASVIPLDKDIKNVAPYIDGISFGLEMETINGTLPAHILAKYGVIICKDGSIKNSDGIYPPEYVTVPMRGAKGLQTARNLSKEIALRSDFDIKCSLHLHLGGMEITRVFLVSMFRLCFKIQNDIFKMFPYYKTDPTGVKQQNYCKKLGNILSVYGGKKDFNNYINDSFVDIYSFLSGGQNAEDNLSTGVKSKRNPWGGQKWDCKTRYFWVNFINPIFGKRDTVEFRIHTPTLNGDKIINWVLMCAAIVRFAENNTERCIKLNRISFEEVLNFYKDAHGTPYAAKLSNNLIAYYNNRADYFQNDFKKGDYVSSRDIADDAKFSFNAIDIK